MDFKDIYLPFGKDKIKRYFHAFTKKELERLIKETGLGIIESKIVRHRQRENILIIARKNN